MRNSGKQTILKEEKLESLSVSNLEKRIRRMAATRVVRLKKGAYADMALSAALRSKVDSAGRFTDNKKRDSFEPRSLTSNFFSKVAYEMT
jgi:hypothetical protein